MIDYFVTYYQGAYTHETAFDLGLEHAYSLKLYHKEFAEYQDRYHSIKRKLEEKK